jgi:hypothetical protein
MVHCYLCSFFWLDLSWNQFHSLIIPMKKEVFQEVIEWIIVITIVLTLTYLINNHVENIYLEKEREAQQLTP